MRNPSDLIGHNPTTNQQRRTAHWDRASPLARSRDVGFVVDTCNRCVWIERRVTVLSWWGDFFVYLGGWSGTVGADWVGGKTSNRLARIVVVKRMGAYVYKCVGGAAFLHSCSSDITPTLVALLSSRRKPTDDILSRLCCYC